MSLALATLTPLQSLGIPVAIVGSLFLAAGAQLQQRGVTKATPDEAAGDDPAPQQQNGLGIRHMIALARRPSWLLGSLLVTLSIIFQLISLYLAPLTVVQPLGAVALVVTALVNARATKTRLTRAAIRAIVLCSGGIAAFVIVAAFTTTTVPIHNTQLVIVMIVVAILVATFGTVFGVRRKRLGSLFYVISGGVLFGFVATLAKVLITRIQTILMGGFHLVPADWLTALCLFALIIAGLLGTYFIQTAYSSGRPDVVVAGLTVIDPLVGVTVGILILGEATSAPLWAGAVFVAAGIIAVVGVFQLSRNQPAARSPR
jgi:drug/metabolite transporter (DMT)-like permease